MLAYLQRLTRRLAWLRPLTLVLALGGAALVTLSLLLPDYQQSLMPGILVMLWSLLAYSFLTLFRGLPVPEESPGLLARLKHKLLAGVYWLLTGVFFILSLGILGVTLRGLFIFFSE